MWLMVTFTTAEAKTLHELIERSLDLEDELRAQGLEVIGRHVGREHWSAAVLLQERPDDDVVCEVLEGFEVISATGMGQAPGFVSKEAPELTGHSGGGEGGRG